VTREFERAKALSPEWPAVYYNLGLLYEKLTFYYKAIENFSDYLKFDSENLSLEEIAKIRVEKKRNHERLELAKRKMEERRWVLIKRIPASKFGG
ncbi:MAG: hypothetical protein QME28_08455, partial [Candidatus Saccharicenans sp.]|nr:hypothetical protein [Candidatus Saccharicenans sp.]